MYISFGMRWLTSFVVLILQLFVQIIYIICIFIDLIPKIIDMIKE